jgi:abortive infection bacteriophage resistance protein
MTKQPYSITANSPARKVIADYFGLKGPVLTTWLHTFVYVQNICAPHARLWNKELRIPVKLPKKTANKWLAEPNVTNVVMRNHHRLIIKNAKIADYDNKYDNNFSLLHFALKTSKNRRLGDFLPCKLCKQPILSGFLCLFCSKGAKIYKCNRLPGAAFLA